MGPPKSFGGAVRVIRLIRTGMVEPVDCHPLNGAVLVSQAPAEGKEVFQGLPKLERTMGQKPVVAEADPEPAGDPLEREKDPESAPIKRKNGPQGHQMD